MIYKFVLSTLLVASLVLSGCQAAALPQTAENEKSPYAGHKVIRVKNPSEAVLSAISSEGFDPWSRGEGFIELHVTGSEAIDTLTKAAGGNLEVETVIDDLQALVDKDRAENASGRESDAEAVPISEQYFKDYYRYPQIVEFVSKVCTQAKSICEFKPSIGKSVEGRNIVAVKLGKAGVSPKKPQIFLTGTQHAREWAATTTVQWIVYQLATQYGKDQRITALLNQVDVVVVPVSNPDGYEYTHTGQRLWRKNRRNNGGRSYGVDLNRNWEYHWDSRRDGASTNPNSDTYRGPKPASEPEVQAISALLKSLPHVVAAIDMHTFSQLLLRQWGDTETPSPHESQVKAVTNEMARIIKGVHGKDYNPIRAIELYPATGVASDYYYSVTKTLPNGTKIHPYGITIELRPKSSWGGGGFILPKGEIIPTGQEILPAFLHYAENAVKKPLTI